MGFLDRIFGKKSGEEDEAPATMGSEEVQEHLARKKKVVGEEVMNGLEEDVEDGVRAARGAGELLEVIKNKEFPEEVEKRIYKPVKTSLPRYVKGMRTAVEGLQPLTGESDIEAYRAFHKKTQQALKSIEKVQISSGRYVALVFEAEMMKIGTHLNNLIDTAREMGEALEEHDMTLSRIEEAEALLGDIQRQKEKIKKVEESPAVIRDEIRSLEEEIGRQKEELDELTESKDYKDMQALEDEKDRAKTEIKMIKNTVFASLSPLGRLFRKYQKLMENTKDEAVLARLSEDPKAIVMDRYDPGPMISKMKKAAEDGYLDLKEKEKKHLWPKLETAMDTDYKGMIEELCTLEARKAEIEAALKESTVGNKKAKLEKEIERSKGRLEKLKSEPMDVDMEKDALEAENREMVERLEEIVGELLDREVSIGSE